MEPQDAPFDRQLAEIREWLGARPFRGPRPPPERVRPGDERPDDAPAVEPRDAER